MSDEKIAIALKYVKLIIAEQKCVEPGKHEQQYSMIYNIAAEIEYNILKTNGIPVTQNYVS